MLKFINENDFLLVDRYKQNEAGSIGWIYNDGNAVHSGFIREGMTRTIQVPDGTEQVKVGEKIAIDSEGNQKLDDDGLPLFEPVYEEQPKYKTETVDIWAKFQALVSKGAITLETEHLLLEQKQSAKDSINATRDALNDADIEYNGYTFQAGAQSREDIMGAVVTGGDTIWLTRDNQEIEMSAEDMRGLGIAIATRKKFLVYKARHFKDALDELSDEASIKAFIKSLDWSA
ncbi:MULTISPECIES: DUF4376 domain-containing protein [Pseudoalteromonas]|uniref:DUF4376 domain-containing protein n=1 Tax=Pseudoalteromonas TaxID=53246 RepID=UPI0002C8A8E4|nr:MULTISPECIES: DUF4376 domain-containing protein [Pseudoalteromonas]ENN99817.1 hypothetical protein J139_04410 [Pseudoalteromonas agarivorans S816]TMS68374.1 DUF4376 domain-containing protein [Pseudoalteromonas sp. S1731]TMS69594.1 DUF4376 domain-containing protein [Pseudoalteromonas sp. S1691]TMS73445.1 DUF4376 domain-containing protein [Pseudoalteromonas sp. S1941]TMS76354.1 DUF4376 domain-containing protein [Pseudoalteromonas sp. S1690]